MRLAGIVCAGALSGPLSRAAAQDPLSRRPAALGEVSRAVAYLGGPGAPGQLNTMFDASRSHPAGIVTPEPRTARRPGAPNKRLETLYRRPSIGTLHQQLVVPVPAETPAYRRTFKIMLENSDKTDQWDEVILRYARIYRLDSRLLKSIMAAESEFDPRAVSPSGARGLMQVMPVTSEGVGIPAAKLQDPATGVKAGAAYIHVLFETAWRIFNLRGVRYTDAPMWVVQRVIAAYHAGPKFLTKLSLYPSTRAYVRKVVLFYHSKVTDLRRPAGVQLELPPYSETVTPTGMMY